MFGFGKKKNNCQLKEFDQILKDHLKTVELCLDITLKTIENYLANDIEKAKEYAKKVDKIETKADQLRRKVSSSLFQGNVMPFLRRDLIQLIIAVDEIANGAEKICDFCLAIRPTIPEFLHKGIFHILGLSQELFHIVKGAFSLVTEQNIAYGIEDIAKLHQITETVVRKESEIDDLQWKLTRNIFESDMELARKMNVESFLSCVCKLSDYMEDVMERLEIIAAIEAV